MKKIILIAILFSTGYCVSAQIIKLPDRHAKNDQKRQEFIVSPVLPGNGATVIQSAQAGYSPASSNQHDQHLNRSCSPTFDPAWGQRFQTVLDSVVTTLNMKGASVAVLSPDQGLWTGVSGISGVGIPVTSEMRFGIGSNTKLFIAVTLEKLQEEGILSLDDHLYQWLPSHPYVDSTTTIRQLLTHQSGIFDFWNDRVSMLTDSIWADSSRFWNAEEILATIGEPHFLPGHGYSYSNTNYLLAGMVIESATGTNWVQKIHDVILDPLVMDSTFVGAVDNRNGPVAHEWDYFNSIEITNPPMTSEYSQGNAAGALLSTAQEMAEWYSALFGGTIITPASLQEITDFEPTSFYGLGLAEGSYYYHPCYNHTGGMLGYASLAWYDVQSKAVLVILMNDRSANFNSAVYPLIDVFYFDRPKKQNDAGISAISAPWGNSCDATVIPSVKLTNFGSEPLTSVDIYYAVDGSPAVSVPWTGNLGTGDSVGVVLPEIPVDGGFHEFICYTAHPNGGEEGYGYNDTCKSNFIVNSLPVAISEVSESFEGNVFPPEGWSEGAVSMFEWGRTSLAGFSGGHSVARANYYDGTMGAIYDFTLPVVNIAAGTHPILEFQYAYAMYPNYIGDSLQVLVSADCGVTWQKLFDNGGLTLRTSPNNLNVFYPQTSEEWKQEVISLADYAGDLIIRFRSVCGYSNNLYVDDINVTFPEDIPANQPEEYLSVYPNPASDQVIVSMDLQKDASVKIGVSDILGREVIFADKGKISAGSSQFPVDIRNLTPGVYLISVNLNGERFTKKIIVE